MKIRRFERGLKKFYPFLFVMLFGLVCFAFKADKPIEHRSFQFTYQMKVGEMPKNAESMEVFMPIPESNQYQIISGMKINAPFPYKIIKKPNNHTSILHFVVDNDIPDSVDITLTFNAERSAILDADQYAKSGYTKEDLAANEMIPITGEIKEQAQIALAQNTLATTDTAEIFYNYIYDLMSYDKSGTGWGHGNAVYACTAKRGNCTDFHSLFIGMCRSVGIPARFFIGFPVGDTEKEGKIGGYYCWAKYYSRQKGWVPVDIAYADEFPDEKSFYFGHLDQNRILFTTGRDISVTAQNGEKLLFNYCVYPKVIINGSESNRVQTDFYYSDQSN